MNLRMINRYRDQVLAAVLGLLYAIEVLVSGEVSHHRESAAAVAVLFAASLVVRTTMPLLPLLAVIAVIQLNHTVLPGLGEGGAFLIALILTIFSAGSYTRGRSLILSGVLVAGIIPLAALDPHQPPSASDWIFFTTFLGTPFVAGIIFRRRRDRDAELTEQARRADEDSEHRAQQAVTAERARVARELHDVVAHAISVIVVQARGGRRMLPEVAESARSSFDAIEHAGEQALVEMRRLLSLLRDVDGIDDLAPNPGLHRLESLVAEVTGTGLPVEVRREGQPSEVPPGVDLSAYRIVQEALTNVLKHAGAATAQVIIRYRTDELEIEIRDDGDGSGPGGGTGHGLDGIRERVGVYGGRLLAEPDPAGGFVVRACLPLGAST